LNPARFAAFSFVELPLKSWNSVSQPIDALGRARVGTFGVSV
jgi:hypothetical protein